MSVMGSSLGEMARAVKYQILMSILPLVQWVKRSDCHWVFALFSDSYTIGMENDLRAPFVGTQPQAIDKVVEI